MKVAANQVVRIEYSLKVKGGEVIESSEKAGPLEYVHGQGRLLPALEKRLDGMGVGESKEGVIPAAEAFGTEETAPTSEIGLGEFPKGDPPTVGRVYEAKAGEKPVQFKVAAVEGDKVKVKFLHPLMGKDLEFKVKVLGVEAPRIPGSPPPVPAAAIGIDSGALVISDD